MPRRLCCPWICVEGESPVYPAQQCSYSILLILCILGSQMIYFFLIQNVDKRQIPIEELFYFHLHTFLILLCGPFKAEFYFILFYSCMLAFSPTGLIEGREVSASGLVTPKAFHHCPLGCLLKCLLFRHSFSCMMRTGKGRDPILLIVHSLQHWLFPSAFLVYCPRLSSGERHTRHACMSVRRQVSTL